MSSARTKEQWLSHYRARCKRGLDMPVSAEDVLKLIDIAIAANDWMRAVQWGDRDTEDLRKSLIDGLNALPAPPQGED